MINKKYLFLILIIMNSILNVSDMGKDLRLFKRKNSGRDAVLLSAVSNSKDIKLSNIGGICTATPPQVMLKEIIAQLKDIILNTYNDGGNYEETIKLLYDLYPKIVDLNEYNQKRKNNCK